jgi:hypothetical protein
MTTIKEFFHQHSYSILDKCVNEFGVDLKNRFQHLYTKKLLQKLYARAKRDDK